MNSVLSWKSIVCVCPMYRKLIELERVLVSLGQVFLDNFRETGLHSASLIRKRAQHSLSHSHLSVCIHSHII